MATARTDRTPGVERRPRGQSFGVVLKGDWNHYANTVVVVTTGSEGPNIGPTTKLFSSTTLQPPGVARGNSAPIGKGVLNPPEEVGPPGVQLVLDSGASQSSETPWTAGCTFLPQWQCRERVGLHPTSPPSRPPSLSCSLLGRTGYGEYMQAASSQLPAGHMPGALVSSTSASTVSLGRSL
jgi:hypothetical protein